MKSTSNNETKINLFIDIAVFILFLIVYEEKATGGTIHEWLGILLGVVLIIHIILHWKWVVSVTMQFINKMKISSRINYIVDFLIFIGFTTITFSGIMMSQSLLPLLGISVEKNRFWHEMHSISVDLTLLFTAFHFALHWKWIVSNFKLYILKPIAGKSSNPVQNESSMINHVSSPVFQKVAFIFSRFILIILFSAIISFGWYGLSQTSSAKNSENEHRKLEYNTENERFTRPSEKNERFAREYGDHDDANAFFILEILKNVLIFGIVTFAVTKTSKRIKRKKEIATISGK